MRRYLRVLRLFWSTALAAEMEYRSNFLLACITSVGHLVGSTFSIWVLYRKDILLGGWSFDQALLVLGFFVFLEGVANTVMRYNLSRIVEHVREGTLDFVLLKPLDSQFWLSTRNCSPWGMPNLLLGLGVMAYAGTRMDLTWTDYLLGVPPLLLGIVMLYSLWFMLGAMSIWFVKVHNITHVLYQLLEAGRFPITAYPPVYQFVFTFIVPVAFLTTVPAAGMIGNTGTIPWLGQNPLLLMVVTVAMAAGLLLASRAWWRFALRFYTSASS